MRGPRRFLGVLTISVMGATTAVGTGAGVALAAGEFTVAPTTLSFPATYVGASSSIAVTVTNVSGAQQSPNFAGGAPIDADNFGGSQNCAGKTFAPGDTCTFTYEFTPTAEGSHSTSTTIDVGADSFSISMSGTGLAPFDVSPTTLTFPDTPVGSTSAIPVTVTNLSPVSQSPNFAGGAPIDPTHFGGSQDCAGKTFAPGDTCAFTYEFTPTAEGPHSTTTSISVGGQDFSLSMSGNGTSANSTTSSSTTEPGGDTTSTTPEDSGSTTTAAPEVPVTAAAGPVTVIGGPLPADSPASVVAQGIVEFGSGTFAWDHVVLEPSGWPYGFVGSPPAFLVDDGPDGLLVTVDGVTSALLDDGEAAFVAAGASGQMTPLFDGAVATGHRVTFVASPGGPGTFAPGAGPRDVNLVRGVIDPREVFDVVSPFPVLVIVVDGTLVNTLRGDAELPAGATATLGPDVALRNDGEAPATVLAVAVGGPVP